MKVELCGLFMKIPKSCLCRFYGVGTVVSSIFLQGHTTSILEDINVEYHRSTNTKGSITLTAAFWTEEDGEAG